ncbi:MAG: UDP-N-acetylglucosamine 1-carboxyvinyltransferase [Phycisphaerales bacterium]
MDAFIIHGQRPLRGEIQVNGSKNAALPLMTAALLTDAPVTLRSTPRLADIRNMARLLSELGVDVSETPGACGMRDLTLASSDESRSHARYDIVRTMRASISVLGPMLARRGYARVSMPGGCAIGDRPVDLHLRGLAALGAEIELESGDIVARAPSGPAGPRLRGAKVFLGGPFGSTVLGTANVMCAATLATGRTIIESAACEPEVVDLATLLNAMGAEVRGAGTPRVIIDGVDELTGADHTVMADRIEAGTYIMAAAITNGSMTIRNCPIDALMALTTSLAEVGVHCAANEDEDPLRATVTVTSDRTLHPVQITTQPHPGFPTDLQAQMMALLCHADGNSVVTERIFPQRFLHVAELSRMGAQLFRQGPTVIVSGVRELVGAPVMASDLRASASLVLAGLAARGTTAIHRVYHLDRGYERMEEQLQALGAEIERVDAAEIPADLHPVGG